MLLGLAACDNGADYGDAIFLTGTLSSQNIRFLVDGESSQAITVSSTAKATEDVKISITVDPSKIDEYNAQTGRNSELPPSGSFSLSGSEVTIKAGTAQSDQLVVKADGDKLKEGVAYCIPVTITSVSGGGLDILESSRTAYLLLTKVIDVKAAYLARTGGFNVYGFKDTKDKDGNIIQESPVRSMSQMTLEMKVKPISFPNSPRSANGISSLVGLEENFLFRFGDGAGNPCNKLQLAKASIGTAFHPDQKEHYEAWAENEFPTNQWLHFAAVYDGSWLRVYLDGEQIQAVETKGGTINLSMAYDGHSWDDCFAIGRSAGNARFFDGCVSECRVWNVARSQAELQDGICYVDPSSAGLVAYWRFNGEVQDGGVVRDETGHGYDATIFGTVQWVDHQKCPF